MLKKNLIQKLGFIPKENTSDIFYKNYKIAENYCIEIDIEKKQFNFGNKIKLENKTTQNFSQEENWVVFECVNRLLEKGYKPEDITLEKIYPTGHGTSGRLDILVKKNKRAYLMIECKTWGQEFDKAFKKLQKGGGQLFTYFQQDTKAEYLMLYTSEFDGKSINYKNEIVKIEEHYKGAGNVKDFYKRWNKISNQNGIFEDWVSAYHFENKAFIKKDLEIFTKEDSESIFNNFESILRKHCVSDAPNAFNKIFNLFLAKIFDEKKRDTDELDFQWKENRDNDVRFQVRLINLYKDGMLEFLKKEIIGINKNDFKESLSEEEIEKKMKEWLMFNNVFAIKEVLDDETFEDNAKVLKEIVQLLSKYKIRYPRQQQHLSNFFERLLTTGLKQKAGQFFTPPPIARFIIKSLPLKKVMETKLKKDKQDDILPSIIDYAAGSGHFLTESMEEMQKIIDSTGGENLHDYSKKKLKNWKDNQFDWASKYIYGIEKDYRLVKVAKVGCYFYGDGLAQIIYGDGLDNFTESKNYRGLLKENTKKPQFDFLISNPPYSVQHFKGDIKNKNPKESFALYDYFTDDSKEIEVLFIERTTQLLKADGIAGIILPSSILSNTGIYTKAREILLKYFEIISITELGSNTFMATGTNTIILFLRRRSDNDCQNIENSIKKFFQNFQDVTVNGIENIFSKYVNFVWKDINFKDYISLTQNKPNKNIQNHEIYIEYKKKIKAKDKEGLQKKIIKIEAEKLLYFILSYPQKVVVVKSGKKNEEKAFLGYEFSNRRGKEGAHPIQRGKTIDECTKLFDPENFNNPQKASTYILDAFSGNFERKIDESLDKNVFRIDLINMMSFDRVNFEKTISLFLKKTLKIKSRWGMVSLGEISELYQPKTITSQEIKQQGKYKVFGANGVIGFYDKYNHEDSEIAITCRGATCGNVNFTEPKSWITGNAMIVRPKNNVIKKYLLHILKNSDLGSTITGTAQPQITRMTLSPFKIPLPPKNIQEKIVSEIKKIEKKEEKNKKRVNRLNSKIDEIIEKSKTYKKQNLGKIAKELFAGGDLPKNKFSLTKTKEFTIPIYSNSSQNEGLYGYTNIIKVDEPCITISARGTIGYTKARNNSFYPIIRLLVLIPKEELAMIKYLEYAIRKLNLNQFGATTPQLTVPQLENFKISLPPISEQKKIVTQILKIEDQISELEKQLQKIPNLKNEVLKKYL